MGDKRMINYNMQTDSASGSCEAKNWSIKSWAKSVNSSYKILSQINYRLYKIRSIPNSYFKVEEIIINNKPKSRKRKFDDGVFKRCSVLKFWENEKYKGGII